MQSFFTIKHNLDQTAYQAAERAFGDLPSGQWTERHQQLRDAESAQLSQLYTKQESLSAVLFGVISDLLIPITEPQNGVYTEIRNARSLELSTTSSADLRALAPKLEKAAEQLQPHGFDGGFFIQTSFTFPLTESTISSQNTKCRALMTSLRDSNLASGDNVSSSNVDHNFSPQDIQRGASYSVTITTNSVPNYQELTRLQQQIQGIVRPFEKDGAFIQ